MKMTQCSNVLLHMKKYGSITHIEAEREYGIMRLASRINDLRRLGYAIESKMVSGINRDGRKTHYASYSLAKEGENV